MRSTKDTPRGRGTAAAIGRSLDVYYRDTERTRRMDLLNAVFVPSGGLAFDVGAHVGDRTASFLRLGASVVALEPQPHVFRALRLLHGRSPRAVLRCVAAGAHPGEIDLHLNTRNPTVSTASRDLIASAASASAWQDQVWDRRIRVPVVTLDQLIAEHGTPDFIKIDVEGHELAVLQGLTTPVPALSFEFTTIQRGIVGACLDRMGALGPYAFNLSLGEDHRLRHDTWLTPSAIQSVIADLPDAANSGDIFARLMP
jgi:FkbM family methyltransferase